MEVVDILQAAASLDGICCLQEMTAAEKKKAKKKAREKAKKAGDAAEGAETAAPAAAKKGGKKVCNLCEDGQKC